MLLEDQFAAVFIPAARPTKQCAMMSSSIEGGPTSVLFTAHRPGPWASVPPLSYAASYYGGCGPGSPLSLVKNVKMKLA